MPYKHPRLPESSPRRPTDPGGPAPCAPEPGTAGPRRPRSPKGTLPAFTPVPRHYNRHDGWTEERQQGFIEALADRGSVKSAAKAVGMTPEGAYLLRRHPEAEGFRAAWKAALKLGVQRLEDVARRPIRFTDRPSLGRARSTAWRCQSTTSARSSARAACTTTGC